MIDDDPGRMNAFSKSSILYIHSGQKSAIIGLQAGPSAELCKNQANSSGVEEDQVIQEDPDLCMNWFNVRGSCTS